MDCLEVEVMRWVYALEQDVAAHPFWTMFLVVCVWLFLTSLLEKDD